MERKFTFYRGWIACTVLILCALFINLFTSKTYAQNNCSNSTVVFSETFGTGVGPVSWPDVLTTGLTYVQAGPLLDEGTYRVNNDVQQKPEWHASEDVTPLDINGRMLIINGQAGAFYSHRIDRAVGFPAGDFTASAFIMNVNTPGTCAPTPLLPVITIRLEYLSEANSWEPLTGSPYTAPAAGQSIDPVWTGIGSTFNVPFTGTFLVKSIRIVLANETAGGCGNDFALDNFTVSQCTAGGGLPVEFLNINARQKGGGVNIEWATAQELNSKSYIIERSADGNSSWSIVTSVNGVGNSLTVKNYYAYDPQPFKGINFYRIRQVDIDGKFQYSKTVSVKLNLNKTAVAVVANPFYNSLTLDFSCSVRQEVSVRLTDITGKQVAIEKWSVNTGVTRKDFSNVNRLPQGVYILTVSNAAGEILYNIKVIKQ